MNLLRLIDRLAGWWMDMRTSSYIRHSKDPNYENFRLKSLTTGKDSIEMTAISPAIAILADEAVQMLEKGNAKNYICFEMLPRLDRGLPPVIVTVQWKNGKSPAQVRDEYMALLNRTEKYLMGLGIEDPYQLLRDIRAALPEDQK